MVCHVWVPRSLSRATSRPSPLWSRTVRCFINKVVRMTTVYVDPEPLSDEHELSMSEFFTLMHLSETPRGRLRMGDVAAATALSLGAVTRVVKLLESKGLVERRPSVAEGRVHEAVLNEAGRQRLEKARPAHVESVRRRIFDKLEGFDLRMCTTALLRMSEDGSHLPHHGRTEP